MDVTPLIRQGTQIIQSYANGQFRVSGTLYKTPVIVTAEAAREWSVQNPAELAESDFEGLTGFDVILLGTGAKIKFLPPVLKKSLKAKGLSPEIMDTGAACRTYNVLVAEGRRVVAALLPYY